MKPNRIALAANTIPEPDPVDFIRIAADAGFDAVGLKVCDSNAARVPLADEPGLVIAVKNALGETGVEVLEVGVFRLSAGISVAAWMPAIELGAELGARMVNVCAMDNDEIRIREKFAELCERCWPLGMRAALEFVPYLYPRNLVEAHRIVSQAPCGAAICVDALHFWRSGSDPLALSHMEPNLFPYAQFCDAVGTAPSTLEGLKMEARTDRCYPGEGALPLSNLLDALPPGLPLSIECPCRSYAHLPPAARARHVAVSTRRFLDAYRSQVRQRSTVESRE